MPDWLAILKAYTDTLEAALGNPTGDMRDVTQSDAADLAAFILRFKEHYRAHDQTRICLVIPGVALDAPNTAIKDELDKIATVSILTEAGCADSQEDWNVYDLIVVGTDSATPFTLITNIDTLITIKLPVVVCCSSAAEELLMGTAVGQSASDLNEWCESVANRVMFRVFTSTGEKELFTENTDSDMLDMSVAALVEQVLMVDNTGEGPAETVVGWLPMETALGITNKLNDGSDIPAGRVFAGCFYKADKLTDLGKDFLRALCRNITQASITPSISLKAQAALVAAIHNDTNQMQGDWAALLVSIASILLDTETTIPDTITAMQADITAILGYVDAEVAAILADVAGLAGEAMRGTDDAALAAAWTAALATALGAYTAARGAYLDELAAANIPADIDGLKTSRDKQLFSMDFWSVPQISVVIPAGALTQTLPDVVVDIPAGVTVVKATAMFKFRMLGNADAANKLTNAQHIQIKKGAGAFVDAISLVDDQFGIAEATREGGDVVVGDHNVYATVDADETYGFQWKDAVADIAGLTFYDLQMGIKIWYSV